VVAARADTATDIRIHLIACLNVTLAKLSVNDPVLPFDNATRDIVCGWGGSRSATNLGATHMTECRCAASAALDIWAQPQIERLWIGLCDSGAL